MKILATIFNLILLVIVIDLLFENGLPKGNDWFVFIAIFLVPIFSLISFFPYKGNNWLSLYIKRKTLEEMQKIDKLNESK